jgi:transcriptional regulator with XRE-family HTH domain
VEDPRKVIEQVGCRIAEAREATGLTQAQVAERVNMTVNNYQRLEHGHQNATIKTLVRIARALDVPVATFWVPTEKKRAGRGRPAKAKTKAKAKD